MEWVGQEADHKLWKWDSVKGPTTQVLTIRRTLLEWSNPPWGPSSRCSGLIGDLLSRGHSIWIRVYPKRVRPSDTSSRAADTAQTMTRVGR